MIIKDVKEWLSRGRFIDGEIRALERECEWIFEKATSVTSKLSDDRVQSSGGNNAERNMIKYAEYSDIISKRIDKLRDIKVEITDKIGMIKDTRLRAVLTDRYINFLRWEDIADRMNYEIRQIFRLHRKALVEMAKVFEKE